MKGISVNIGIRRVLIIALIALFSACKKEADEKLSTRLGVDVDVIEFPYTAFEHEITVKANAPWVASVSDDSWLSLGQTEGTVTDGSPEKLSVQVTRNTGLSREATVTIAIDGQPDIEILVVQAEGSVLLGDAGVKGVIKQDRDMSEINEISIPYTRGGANQTLTVSVTASGDGAAGIMPIEDMVLTATALQGTLSIPLSGKPLNQGGLEFAVSFSNGVVYSIPAQVVGTLGEIYYNEKFDKMIWGGDYVGRKDGVKGGFKLEGTSYVIDESIPVTEVDYLTPGSHALLTSGGMAISYRILRGILAEVGAKAFGGDEIFERPGYLQVGNGLKSVGLITRSTWSIPSGQHRKVKVSVDLAIWEGGSPKVRITKSAGGGELSVSEFEVQNHDKWKTYEFIIDEATNATRIRFLTAAQDADGVFGRFFIKNIVVQEMYE